MKLKVYTVDVPLPRWSKRLLLFTAIAAAMVLAVVTVVRAASGVPNTFANGDQLSASKMNANFSALQSQIDSTNGTLTTVQQTMIAADANGNVGIGTKNPTEKLDVAGNLKLGPANNAIMFTDPGNYDFSIAHSGGVSLDIRSPEYGGGITVASFMNNGNVGIGTTNPFARLQSEGPTTPYDSDSGLVSAQVSGTGKRVNIGFDTGINAGFVQSVQSGAGNRPLLLNANGGLVGVGMTSPQYALDVRGTIRGDNLTPSDRSLKKNIAPLHADTSARVQKLDGVAFEWDQQKTSGLSTKPQIGLIAQDVEKVFPSLVETDGKGIKSIHYMGVTAVLLEAVKAQQKQIEALQNHVRSLENRLSPTASAAMKPTLGRRLARRDVL